MPDQGLLSSCFMTRFLAVRPGSDQELPSSWFLTRATVDRSGSDEESPSTLVPVSRATPARLILTGSYSRTPDPDRELLPPALPLTGSHYRHP